MECANQEIRNLYSFYDKNFDFSIYSLSLKTEYQLELYQKCKNVCTETVLVIFTVYCTLIGLD